MLWSFLFYREGVYECISEFITQWFFLMDEKINFKFFEADFEIAVFDR